MKLLRLFLSALATLLAACATPPSADSPARVAELARRVVDDAAANADFNGAVVLMRDGQVLFQQAVGLAQRNPDRPFSVDTPSDGGSLAKTLTAAAVWELVAEGRLSWSDRVTRYVPEYPYEGQTLRDLLMHRNGLPDYGVFDADFARLTMEHMVLVFVSLALSIVAGVPLGVWCANSAAARRWVLPAVGLIQTVPSLALLAFLITFYSRIGLVPTLTALFLYGLLPIVRNTCAGLEAIPQALRDSGRALGLPRGARLLRIELPLALGSILAGVQTSAVINVGTATIAAFIGAGGYGERIATGLALNDTTVLLAGALPAAALALLVQLGFGTLERWALPAPLRGVRQ